MDHATLWWLAAGGAVLAELLTGTFYLLMIGLGLVAGALAAHLGATPTLQMAIAAACGAGAVAAWHLRRGRHRGEQLPASRNPDVNLDIGQHVHVSHWHADGTARVHYRGASWAARHESAGSGTSLSPGDFIIREINGSELLLGTAPTH